MALMIAPLCTNAQMRPFVLLEKAGTNKRVRYYTGDEIRFVMKGDDAIKSGTITGLNDTVFFLDQNVGVNYGEVEKILVARSGAIRAIGISSFYAIPSILLITAANNQFNTGRTPIIDDTAWGLSGVFAAIGIASFAVSPDKNYKLKKRWRLIAVIH